VTTTPEPKRRRAEILLALGVLALAATVGWETAMIPVAPAYARIGPSAFPAGVALGLALLGTVLLWQAATGRWTVEESAEEAGPIDWRAIGWLLLGLVLNVALIQPLGFTIASTLLFVCVARAFGSTRLPRDVAVAFVLAAVAYVGFDRVLGVEIGTGLLESLF
jgi:putative tricarboxylic transport membrane protein